MESVYNVLVSLRGRDQLGDLGIDGRIILCVLKKWDVRVWAGFR
jgi:hypothetical protein